MADAAVTGRLTVEEMGRARDALRAARVRIAWDENERCYRGFRDVSSGKKRTTYPVGPYPNIAAVLVGELGWKL